MEGEVLFSPFGSIVPIVCNDKESFWTLDTFSFAARLVMFLASY
ncbi:hypothetical protein Hdeb2414_s0001g00008561 [Helianthus debilis subsp. tardiflorus]